eukprot:COSAG01_NODE_3419_length_6120_cov_9.941538_2_plen_69_part_00
MPHPKCKRLVMNSLDFKHHPEEEESSKSEEGGRELFENAVNLRRLRSWVVTACFCGTSCRYVTLPVCM